jgi:hypothetical protein
MNAGAMRSQDQLAQRGIDRTRSGIHPAYSPSRGGNTGDGEAAITKAFAQICADPESGRETHTHRRAVSTQCAGLPAWPVNLTCRGERGRVQHACT